MLAVVIHILRVSFQEVVLPVHIHIFIEENLGLDVKVLQLGETFLFE